MLKRTSFFSKLLVFVSVFVLGFVIFAHTAQAQSCGKGSLDGCKTVGQACGPIAGDTCQFAAGLSDLCVCTAPKSAGLPQQNSDESNSPSNSNTNPFGVIDPPPGVAAFNQQNAAAGGKGIGLIPFVSNVIKVFTIIAGVLVFFNFIIAGYTYVTSPGDTSAQNKMRDQITNSVIGLVIIVASYTIIAILSLLIFGKADFILNPVITGPTP
jgi:hypothetical protein